MADSMNHKERVRATLKGETPDRVAVSMWRHFFREETAPEPLAEAMLGFQKRFDWDFVKVNPRSGYHSEGWGLKKRYTGVSEPTVVDTPVKEPDDWLKLDTLAPDEGALGEHLKALEIIADGLDDDVPFLMTIFTPLSIAADLAPSEETFVQHLREHPDKVRHALEVVTETFTDYALACFERGISGLFYATTSWATSNRLTEEEYRTLAMPYDLKLLNELPPAEFNILHVCKTNNYLRLVKDYPVHAFNWDARGGGNLSLAEGSRILSGKTVIGGIGHETNLRDASPERLSGEVAGMRAAMGSTGWMLGGGCTFMPDTPEANLDAIRAGVVRDIR